MSFHAGSVIIVDAENEKGRGNYDTCESPQIVTPRATIKISRRPDIFCQLGPPIVEKDDPNAPLKEMKPKQRYGRPLGRINVHMVKFVKFIIPRHATDRQMGKLINKSRRQGLRNDNFKTFLKNT